ncbi:MAG: carbonic anhydrase [Nitrososphaera sp.]
MIEKHGSKIIAVVGHYDCAGNPGDSEHHYIHIQRTMREVSSWNLHVQVIGLYVDDKREVEKVK